jgi:hypothetical protein
MPQNQDEGIRELLLRHAKNLLRITSIPTRKEAEEFRNLIRAKLESGGLDIGLLIREIQENAYQRAEAVATKDRSLREYYLAVYTETAFLLSALTRERWTLHPRLAETA